MSATECDCLTTRSRIENEILTEYDKLTGSVLEQPEVLYQELIKSQGINDQKPVDFQKNVVENESMAGCVAKESEKVQLTLEPIICDPCNLSSLVQ